MWQCGFDFRCGLDTVHLRHDDVHKHESRMMSKTHGKGLPPILRFYERAPLEKRSQELLQSKAYGWMVIHNEHAYGFAQMVK